jgi:hypothetical protein
MPAVATLVRGVFVGPQRSRDENENAGRKQCKNERKDVFAAHDGSPQVFVTRTP